MLWEFVSSRKQRLNQLSEVNIIFLKNTSKSFNNADDVYFRVKIASKYGRKFLFMGSVSKDGFVSELKDFSLLIW